MAIKIYKSAGGESVLQSVTEIKHLSGLLAVSAEFLQVSAGSLPSQIPSSIGSLDVYPPPTVTKDTSGLAKINATAYGVWNSTRTEETFNISLYYIKVGYVLIYPDGSGRSVALPPEPAIIESGWVKKIGAGVPTLSRPLTIISPTTFNFNVEGQMVSGTPQIQQYPSMVRQNKFGSVTETEAAYEIRAVIKLGSFNAF